MLRKLLMPDPVPAGGGPAIMTATPVRGDAPPPSAAPTASGRDVFSSFDDTFKDDGDASASPSSTPAPAPTKPTGNPNPPKGAAKPEPKPAATTQPKSDEYEDVEGVQVPKALKLPQDANFRGWGLKGHKRAKELEGQLAEKDKIVAEYNQLKDVVPKTTAERDAIKAQMDALRKEHDAVMGEFKLVKYEASPEYRDKYAKPYESAIQSAIGQVKELLVEVPDPNGEIDGETGNVKLIERAATVGDFEQVLQQPLGAATKLAKKLFGDAASIVLGHRQKIKDLATAAQAAVSEYKGKASEIEKANSERMTLERSKTETMWTDFNRILSTDAKMKDIWGEEGDPEIDNELKRGFALADKRFSEGYNSLSTQDKVALDSLIRHRVAASFKLAKKNRSLATENEQLKKDLAEIRGSGPGDPSPNGGKTSGGDGESIWDKLDKL